MFPFKGGGFYNAFAAEMEDVTCFLVDRNPILARY